jgi:hypothetical protein
LFSPSRTSLRNGIASISGIPNLASPHQHHKPPRNSNIHNHRTPPSVSLISQISPILNTHCILRSIFAYFAMDKRRRKQAKPSRNYKPTHPTPKKKNNPTHKKKKKKNTTERERVELTARHFVIKWRESNIQLAGKNQVLSISPSLRLYLFVYLLC